MDETGFYTLILVGLIFFDMVVVAARFSFNQVNLARLLSLREQQVGAAKRAIDLIHKPERLQASLHFLRLLCWFLTAGALLSLGTIPGAAAWGEAIRWGLLALFALFIFLLEQGIGALTTRNPEGWAIRLSAFTAFWVWILAPVSGLALLLRHGRLASDEAPSMVTQDELISMLDAGHQEGVLEQDEREMIYSIFRLGDTLTREIMVPRIYITALDVNSSLTAAVDALLAAGHSRAPVYEENIDNIIGLVYAKDLLSAWRDNSQTASLRSLLREVYFVPEAKKVDELLDEMQARRVHMALVVDEYGGIAGLVTLEDIVEEIVGEIRDEYDQMEELPYQAVGVGEYVVQGRIDLDDFNSLMHTSLPRDEAETLSGFIYNQVGRVPENGEKIVVDTLEIIVEEVVGRRIRKVRARLVPDTQFTGQEKEESSADS
jgi:CBS domain containing-hemolysin-like protein